MKKTTITAKTSTTITCDRWMPTGSTKGRSWKPAIATKSTLTDTEQTAAPSHQQPPPTSERPPTTGTTTDNKTTNDKQNVSSDTSSGGVSISLDTPINVIDGKSNVNDTHEQ